MDFEEYIKEIQKKIKNFCKKYDLWDLRNDLFTEAWIVFRKCEEKFKGNEENFRRYFLKSLDNHFKNYVIREMRIRSREFFLDDFENIEDEIKSEEDLVERLDVKNLSEDEIWFWNLLRQGFKLKEVAEKLCISYERAKDIWSEIKAKLNPHKKSRREIRKKWRKRNKKRVAKLLQKWKDENPLYFKEWRNRNPDYYKNWKDRNPDYFRKYQSIKRILKNEADFKKVLKDFLKFLCNCENVNLDFVESRNLFIYFLCNSLCFGKILLYEDFEEGEFDKVVIFSNLNSLKIPESQLRKKRIFIYDSSHFKKKREWGLLPDFSKKKVLILTKFQKR